jgi:hypothetical protein
MAVVQEAVEHGGDGRAVAEQFPPVLDRAVGGDQSARAFVTTHDDLQQLFCRKARLMRGSGSRLELRLTRM